MYEKLLGSSSFHALLSWQFLMYEKLLGGGAGKQSKMAGLAWEMERNTAGKQCKVAGGACEMEVVTLR